MSTYEVLLQKKGRGRGAFALSRPWAVRNFKLIGQSLEYYDVDKLKGTIDIAGCTCRALKPDEADNKPFPLEIDTGKEKLILNASCEEIRSKCLSVFTSASKRADWDVKKPAASTTAAETPTKTAGVALASLAAAEENQLKIAKLEEEQKKLEAERLKQHTAAAAKVMEEELANKMLREAQEAEKRQQEQQQRQAVELLKSMGAKARFFAALKSGQKDIAMDAAATMLQGAWRSKVARRRVAIQRAEKERLRQSGYAKKIQCRYRARLARKKVEAIKLQKLQNRKNIAVLKFQCVWRIYCAKKIFACKQEMKLEAQYKKTIARQRGIIRIQNAARAFLARRKVNLLVNELTPSVAFVTVLKTEGLNLYNPSQPCDPTVIVTGVTLDVARTSTAITQLNYTVPEEIVRSKGKAVSHYRLDAMSQQKPCLVTASNKLDFIAITLVDRNTPNKDDCIGQATVRISDIRRKMKKDQNSVEVTVPLHSMAVAVSDANGTAVTVRRAPTGTVTINVNLCDRRYSCCGWLWKVSESLYTNAWKKRWFVLTEGQLTYYNSELALEQPKHTVIGRQITNISEEPHKGRDATKLSYTWENTETFWQLDFDEEAPSYMKAVWMRRIYRCAPGVTDPSLFDLKSKFAIVKSAKPAESISPLPRTRAPVAKRMSIFK